MHVYVVIDNAFEHYSTILSVFSDKAKARAMAAQIIWGRRKHAITQKNQYNEYARVYEYGRHLMTHYNFDRSELVKVEEHVLA